MILQQEPIPTQMVSFVFDIRASSHYDCAMLASNHAQAIHSAVKFMLCTEIMKICLRSSAVCKCCEWAKISERKH